MVSPSRGTSLHGFGIHHRHRFLQWVGHALPSLQLCALVGGQIVPARLLRADRGGAIGFRQPIDVRQLDADTFRTFQHCNGRRGTGDQTDHGLRGRGLRRVGRIDQRVVDDRRAAHVRDAVFGNQLKDLRRVDLAQANVDAGRCRNGPWKAPAVAMKHRQRPQIDRMLAEVAGQDVADGVEIGAAVVGNDALGIAGGSGSIAERDGVPFVLRRPCGKVGVALCHGIFVFELADPLSAGKSRVVDVDQQWLWAGHQRQRLGNHAGKFGIDQEDLGAAMVELKRDGVRLEADVQGVEHSARHRHREMHLVHRGDVRQHRRDRVATADTALGQERRETPAAFIGLTPGEDAAFVYRAGEVRVDGGGALEKAQGRQRHEIGRCLFQSDAVMTLITHRFDPLREFREIRSKSKGISRR